MNIEHRTSNIERRILWRYALSILNQANLRMSKGSCSVFPSLFCNSTEYLIRCWTFDVRCSMFIFSAFSAKNNLALMRPIPGSVPGHFFRIQLFYHPNYNFSGLWLPVIRLYCDTIQRDLLPLKCATN